MISTKMKVYKIIQFLPFKGKKYKEREDRALKTL